jgi:hypothetical protein
MNIIESIGKFYIKDFIKNFDKIVSPYQVWKFTDLYTRVYKSPYLYLGENPKIKGYFINSAMLSDVMYENPERVLRNTRLNS